EDVVAWLSRFHAHLQLARIAWDERAIERYVDAPLRRFESTLGVTPEEARLFAAARSHAAGLSGVTVPEVWQHAGFSGINLFLDGREVHVIDWEASCRGLPLLDLLYFAAEWSHTVKGARSPDQRVADFRAVFLSD